MSRTTWLGMADRIHELMRALSVHDRAHAELGAEKGFLVWQHLAQLLRRNKRTVYLIGNGASASMASHFAADLAKNGRMHSEVFSDLSLITAISNDIGYEEVFAEPLRRRCRSGDMLVAISSSGRSPNVLAAVRVARSRGVTVVTLSAMKPENPLRKMGDLNFYVPGTTYGEAESCHAAVLHYWMDLVQYKPSASKSTAKATAPAANSHKPVLV